MKILSHGTIYDQYAKEKNDIFFLCDSCGCEFSKFHGEFTEEKNSQYESLCPECGEKCFSSPEKNSDKMNSFFQSLSVKEGRNILHFSSFDEKEKFLKMREIYLSLKEEYHHSLNEIKKRYMENENSIMEYLDNIKLLSFEFSEKLQKYQNEGIPLSIVFFDWI